MNKTIIVENLIFGKMPKNNSEIFLKGRHSHYG